MIQAVIFDLDGTLINTWDLYMEAYRFAAKPYLKKEITEEEIIELKPTTERIFIEKISPEGEQKNAYQRFLDKYVNSHDHHYKGEYHGIIDLLTRLREKKYQLALVTGKSRQAWELTQEKLQLGHFETIITDNDVKRSKPDPEGALLALQKLNLKPEEAIFVGDTYVDYLVAHQAGMMFAAALWAKTDQEIRRIKEKMQTSNNTVLLQKPADLLAHLSS